MKWKLDAQLYSLLARYVCDLHALHDLWPRCDAKVRHMLLRAMMSMMDYVQYVQYVQIRMPPHVCLLMDSASLQRAFARVVV